MNKIAQQIPDLVVLRNSVVKFYRNLKMTHDKLKTAAPQGVIPQAVLEAYKPFLEKIGLVALGPEFTTVQLKNHLRYLESILKRLSSINAMQQDVFVTKYGQQPYYRNLYLLGNEIKELLLPAAMKIKSDLPDELLIKSAKEMASFLDKTGANLVSKLSTYLDGLGPNNTLGRVSATTEKISIEKLSQQIEAYFRLTYHW